MYFNVNLKKTLNTWNISICDVTSKKKKLGKEKLNWKQ